MLDAQQECALSLNQRRAEIGRLGTLQDVMVLIGGSVSAGGGITAAVFSGAATTEARAATIVSASIAAASGLVAIASKLVEDPSIQTNRHALKRQHYDAGMSVLRQNGSTTITGEARKYVIARFTSCTKDQPEPDVPTLPAGALPVP